MYRALQANDIPGAIRHAQAAVELAPEHPGFRLALVHALLRGDRFPQAEKAASEALAMLPDSAAPLALRAYARQRQGRMTEARGDLERAMQQKNLAPDDSAQLLLIAQNPGAAPPSIDCTNVERTQTCSIRAGAAPAQPGYEAAAAAYKAMEARDFARALESARQATAAAPARRDWQLLQMQAAFEQQQWAEALRAADAALALQATDAQLLLQRSAIKRRMGDEAGAREDELAAVRLGGLQPIDLAYVSVRMGDDEAARAAFARADGSGNLPESALLDAGYTAMRARRDAEAVSYFMRAIDANESLKLKMEPQLVYDTRRTISEIERKFGVLASLTWRQGGGAVPGFGTTGGSTGSRVLQAGAEAYWRPWGFRNGQFVELFLRGFQTLHSENGGTTGSDSFEGAAGVRWKVLSGHNAVLSFSRVFGTQIDSEWLAQAAYSLDHGTDIRVDVPSWYTYRFSAEVGRYFGRDVTYGLAQVQAGRSFRVGGGNTIMFPHAVLAAEYDSSLAERTAVGFGPGLGVRHWFREDKYHAPRSYFDVTLQYRIRLAGDDRARGPYLGALLSY